MEGAGPSGRGFLSCRVMSSWASPPPPVPAAPRRFAAERGSHRRIRDPLSCGTGPARDPRPDSRPDRWPVPPQPVPRPASTLRPAPGRARRHCYSGTVIKQHRSAHRSGQHLDSCRRTIFKYIVLTPRTILLLRCRTWGTYDIVTN